MSHVSYNSNRLIPSPFIQLEKVYERTQDGTLVGITWRGNIIGKIISFKGSPNSSGVFHQLGGYPADQNLSDSQQLASIIRKQEAIRSLFSIEGKSLEIQSEDGSAPMKMNPKITSITFPDGLWYYTADYNIAFETPIIYVNGTALGEDTFNQYLSDKSETWQIETEETPESEDSYLQKTYRLTHNVSAVGKRVYDNNGTLVKESWVQAREWVKTRLGFDFNLDIYSAQSGSVMYLPDYYQGYNFVRTENIGKTEGNYAVSETWLLTSGTALENFTVETRTSAEDGKTNVSINGTITGLDVRTESGVITSKYTNAISKFTSVSGTLLSRAQLYAGVTLNPYPLTTSVAKNPVDGVITYSSDYNNRPSNMIPGTASEVISINDNLGTDVVAIVPVVGRALGPVLQSIGTSRERRRTLNIEIVMRASVQSGITGLLNSDPIYFGSSATAINDIVNAVNPSTSLGASQSYLDENQHNWEPMSQRASLTKTWIYEI